MITVTVTEKPGSATGWLEWTVRENRRTVLELEFAPQKREAQPFYRALRELKAAIAKHYRVTPEKVLPQPLPPTRRGTALVPPIYTVHK